jgi:hypothetical protein
MPLDIFPVSGILKPDVSLSPAPKVRRFFILEANIGLSVTCLESILTEVYQNKQL